MTILDVSIATWRSHVLAGGIDPLRRCQTLARSAPRTTPTVLSGVIQYRYIVRDLVRVRGYW